jgi:Protein of unknown function (DUF3987)
MPGLAMNKGEDDIRSRFNDAKDETLAPPYPLVREPPSGQPFPLDTLGTELGGAVRAIVDRTQVPIALAAQSVLSTSALVVQAHGDVHLPIGGKLHVRPLSEDHATVAVSGKRKTTADDLATWPVRKHERKLRERHKEAMQSYRDQKEAWEDARDWAKRDCNKGDKSALVAALKAVGPEPDRPLDPLMLCEEPTFEGLCQSYITGQPSIGLFSNEGGSFVGGHAMRPETILRTATGLSDLWDGKAVRRVRVTGVVILPGRRFACHLMMQPSVMQMLLSNRTIRQQGLFSRFLINWPESTIGTRLQRTEAPETQPALDRYFACLLNILELRFPLEPDTLNELKPRVLELADAATVLWKRYADYIELELPAGRSFEAIQALACKAAEHAARLAGILTLIDDIEAGEISAERLGAGIELANYYLAEALRLDAIGTGEQESEAGDALQQARKLLQYLQTAPFVQNGMVCLVDLYQRGPTSLRTKQAASQVMSVLEDHRYVARIAGGAVINGAKRQDVWRLVGMGKA